MSGRADPIGIALNLVHRLTGGMTRDRPRGHIHGPKIALTSVGKRESLDA